jgi:hypothetical protein
MNIVLVNIWLDPERGTGIAERTRRLARSLVDLGCACSLVTMGSTPWHMRDLVIERGEDRARVTTRHAALRNLCVCVKIRIC